MPNEKDVGNTEIANPSYAYRGPPPATQEGLKKPPEKPRITRITRIRTSFLPFSFVSFV